MANPYASVVILSTGQAPKVMECLKKQTFQDFEIIFANDRGIVRAMNKALTVAKGEIIVRIDDDVEMPERWLGKLLRQFENPYVVGTTGPTFVKPELRKNRDSIRYAENPKGVLRWLYDGNKFKPGGIRKSGCVSYDSNYKERIYSKSGWWWGYYYKCDHLEGTNWAMRKELIFQVGGFDEDFDGVAEWFDTDVEQKVLKLDKIYMLAYNPDAYLYHNLEKGEHYNDRFEGFGRIKNFIRFHWRHGRQRFLNIKFYIYLIVWGGYFVCSRYRS